jgi:hypothetical protein
MYSDYRINGLRIADYQPGDFSRCQASFVVSVEHEHRIPKVLLNEFSNNEKNISWLGENIGGYHVQYLLRPGVPEKTLPNPNVLALHSKTTLFLLLLLHLECSFLVPFVDMVGCLVGLEWGSLI